MIGMDNDDRRHSRSRMFGPLADLGGRAASATLRPLTGAVGAAAGAGISLERRAVDRLLESGELERFLASAQFQAIVAQVVRSDGATQLIDTFFDSGLFDRFVDRLLASDGLWRLVDVIAASPAVRAAISQQGLGFADQLGDVMRERSRKGDRRLERVADHLMRRDRTASRQTSPQGGEGQEPGGEDEQPTHLS